MVSRRTLLTAGAASAGLAALGYALWPSADHVSAVAAQQRDLPGADPDLREFIRMATLAANGHNTQPWKFGITKDLVSVYPDLTRRTEVVDPDDHHLYVSLGCAVENFVVAANANGRVTEIDIITEDEPRVDMRLTSGAPSQDTLYKAIPLRQTTRSIYDGQPISSSDMDLLTNAARQDGVEMLIFTDPADLEAILEFVVAGNSAQIDDPAFVKELEAWLRFSSGRAIDTNDGLFSACSGNPAMPDWLGKLIFRAVFTKDAENDKYSDHLRSSAGVAVFFGEQEGPESWIKVGQSFERFALQATALGIRNAHLNMPIEVPSIRPDFASAIRAPGKRPDLVIRFGRAPTMPMSLRRSVSEVLL